MGFFKITTKEGPGVSEDEARSPTLIRFFKVLGAHFWQMVVLNALYVFACLPDRYDRTRDRRAYICFAEFFSGETGRAFQ